MRVNWQPAFFSVCLGFFFCLACIVPAHADLKISPAYVDLVLDKGQPTGEFSISNVGDTEERYRINSIFYVFTKDGMLARVEPNDRSMASWIVFNPKEFTLPPKKSRKVRFIVQPKGQLRPGEYWAAMELESLNRSITQGKSEDGHDMKLQVIPTIIVPIFGNVGQAVTDANLAQVQVTTEKDDTIILAPFKNTGTKHITATCQYEILDAQGKSVAKKFMGRTLVLPGLERNFTAEFEKSLPAGQYTIKVTCTGPQLETPLTGETSYEWKPPAITQQT